VELFWSSERAWGSTTLHGNNWRNRTLTRYTPRLNISKHHFPLITLFNFIARCCFAHVSLSCLCIADEAVRSTKQYQGVHYVRGTLNTTSLKCAEAIGAILPKPLFALLSAAETYWMSPHNSSFDEPIALSRWRRRRKTTVNTFSLCYMCFIAGEDCSKTRLNQDYPSSIGVPRGQQCPTTPFLLPCRIPL
jgi:hypothetical protein